MRRSDKSSGKGKGRRPVVALRHDDFFEDPRQRILIYRRRNQEPYVQHRHEFFEIVVVFSGIGEHVTGDFRHTVQSGDVLVINNRRAHGYEKTEHLSLINILIQEDLLLQLAAGLDDISGYHALFGAESALWRQAMYTGHMRLSPEELRQVEGWIVSIEHELALKQQSSFLLAEAYLALIIGMLSRRYGKPAAALPLRPVFEALSRWLEERLDEPLSVPDMARHAGMSERSFYRAFRAAMGVSPKEHLQNMRLRKAATLLRQGGARQSIIELAQQVGFEDSNYFSRSFRRFFGVCPRRFRQSDDQCP